MEKTINTAALISFVLSCLMATLTLFGQENQKNKVIKLYSNISLTRTETTLNQSPYNLTSTVENNNEMQIGYFTPSIAFVLPNGNFHEIELSQLVINNTNNETIVIDDSSGQTVQPISGQITTNVSIAMRYEYDVLFFKKKEGAKLMPYLGFSMNPYFSNKKYSSKISTSFPTNQNSFGALLSIVPRLNYNLNENWFIDVNVPVNIVDLNVTVNSNDNPALTEQQRSSSTLGFAMFPSKFLVRFGVGLRI